MSTAIFKAHYERFIEENDEITDALLIKKYRENIDKDGVISYIYIHNKGLFYKYREVWRGLGEHDCDSAILLAIYKALEKFDDTRGAKFITFLVIHVKEAFNKHMIHLNAKRRQPEAGPVASFDFNTVADGDNPMSNMLGYEQHEFYNIEVQDFLDKVALSNRERYCFYKHTFLKSSQRELANELNTSQATIWRYLDRATDKIANYYDKTLK